MGTQVDTFKFIEEVHNCPSVSDGSKIRKTNKRKWKSYRTNCVSSKPFYFSIAFCFFSSLSRCYCSLLFCGLILLQVGHVENYRVSSFDASLTCESTSLPTFWSMPTRVRQLKFAVWRPLNLTSERCVHLLVMNSLFWWDWNIERALRVVNSES